MADLLVFDRHTVKTFTSMDGILWVY